MRALQVDARGEELADGLEERRHHVLAQRLQAPRAPRCRQRITRQVLDERAHVARPARERREPAQARARLPRQGMTLYRGEVQHPHRQVEEQPLAVTRALILGALGSRWGRRGRGRRGRRRRARVVAPAYQRKNQHLPLISITAGGPEGRGDSCAVVGTLFARAGTIGSHHRVQSVVKVRVRVCHLGKGGRHAVEGGLIIVEVEALFGASLAPTAAALAAAAVPSLASAHGWH